MPHKHVIYVVERTIQQQYQSGNVCVGIWITVGIFTLIAIGMGWPNDWNDDNQKKDFFGFMLYFSIIMSILLLVLMICGVPVFPVEIA